MCGGAAITGLNVAGLPKIRHLAGTIPRAERQGLCVLPLCMRNWVKRHHYPRTSVRHGLGIAAGAYATYAKQRDMWMIRGGATIVSL